MKYKERRGNVFVFDDNNGKELIMTSEGDWFIFGRLRINDRLMIDLDDLMGVCNYKRIKTAVNLMTILKDEGLG